jgi:Flp pilus assembly pilin Flp
VVTFQFVRLQGIYSDKPIRYKEKKTIMKKNMEDSLMLAAIRTRIEIQAAGRKMEQGQNTTEYGIFIAGVVVVVLLVVGIFSNALQSLWNRVAALISGG